MADELTELPLRAGPAPTSPPLPIAVMILLLGIIGPILFVRVAVPSPFLTIAALLLPIAGVIAMIAAVGSWRQRRTDRHVRTRAIIGPDGIVLLPRHGPAEPYGWTEIAAAHATSSVLMLHLKGDGGKHTRRAIRYGALETPVAMIEGRITVALQNTRTTAAGSPLS